MRIIGRYDKTPWFYPDLDNVDGIISGDWHISDKYAAVPKNPATKEGVGIKPAKIQKYIREELKKILKEIGHVKLLILPGDLTEGVQKNIGGGQVIDTDADNQVEWTFQFYEETFYEYCNPEHVLITMGTPYHVMVGIGGNLDYQVASKISRISDVTFGYPNLQFYLGAEKKLWDVRHRISIARVNQNMPLEKTFRYFYRMQAENGNRVPDVIGRAHNHSLVREPFNVSGGSVPRYAWVSPCLKSNDIYGQQLRYPGDTMVGVISFSQGGGVTGRYHAIDINKLSRGVVKV